MSSWQTPPRPRHVGRRRQWPDTIDVLRTTTGGWNTITQTYDNPTTVIMWSGPAAIEPADQTSQAVSVAEQQVTVQPYRIRCPLTVRDVRPDDRIYIAASDDPYLNGRTLTVVRVEASSHALERILHAIDNQG